MVPPLALFSRALPDDLMLFADSFFVLLPAFPEFAGFEAFAAVRLAASVRAAWAKEDALALRKHERNLQFGQTRHSERDRRNSRLVTS